MTDPTNVVPVVPAPYIKDTERADPYSDPEGEARARLAASPLQQLRQKLETGTSRANPQT